VDGTYRSSYPKDRVLFKGGGIVCNTNLIKVLSGRHCNNPQLRYRVNDLSLMEFEDVSRDIAIMPTPMIPQSPKL